MTIPVTVGTVIAIQVDGYSGGRGSVQLSIELVPSPPNDYFTDAEVRVAASAAVALC